MNVESAEQFRRFGCGGAVGAIHQDPQLAKVRLDVGGEVFDVGVTEFGLAGKRWLGDFQSGVVGGRWVLEQRFLTAAKSVDLWR